MPQGRKNTWQIFSPALFLDGGCTGGHPWQKREDWLSEGCALGRTGEAAGLLLCHGDIRSNLQNAPSAVLWLTAHFLKKWLALIPTFANLVKPWSKDEGAFPSGKSCALLEQGELRPGWV